MNPLKRNILNKYAQLDRQNDAGEDVVRELRQEIKNLELAYLKEVVLPEVAQYLGAWVSDLRCDIDATLQRCNDMIEYSFCTSNSMLMIKDSIDLQTICDDERTEHNETKPTDSNYNPMKQLPDLFSIAGIELQTDERQIEEPEIYRRIVPNQNLKKLPNLSSKKKLFSINGSDFHLGKNRTVLQCVRMFLKEIPTASFEDIEMMFPKELQGSYGVVRSLEDVRNRSVVNKSELNRWFLKETDILKSADNIQFVVCTEWGHQFDLFVKYIKDNFGWEITEVRR